MIQGRTNGELRNESQSWIRNGSKNRTGVRSSELLYKVVTPAHNDVRQCNICTNVGRTSLVLGEAIRWHSDNIDWVEINYYDTGFYVVIYPVQGSDLRSHTHVLMCTYTYQFHVGMSRYIWRLIVFYNNMHL